MKHKLDASAFAPKPITEDQALKFLCTIWDDLKNNGVGNGAADVLERVNAGLIMISLGSFGQKLQYIIDYGKETVSIIPLDKMVFWDFQMIASPCSEEEYSRALV